MLEEEHVARGEGRPRIIQVLRQMQGYVTAKMIAEAAEVSEGTVYLNRYRTLVVEENIRRVKEEPTRLLLELPQRGETDDELKVKAKFLDDLIEKYNLEDVISGTVEDVEVMMDILMLLDIKLPQSILEAITVHAYRGFKGQAVDRVSLMDFHGYQEIPETIKIRNYKKETDETSIIFEGQVPVGFSQVQIVGDRNKTVEVDGNGRFRTRIILAKGKEVKLTFFGFNEDNKQRTQIQNVTVKQTSQEITPEEVLADLMYQKEEVRKEIESKPVILKYVISRLELGLLQYFTEDEEEGMRQIALRIKRAQNSHNDLMEKIYVSIQDKFNQIKDLRIDDFREQDDLGRPQKMYFYQKYIFYEVEERIMQKLSGDNDSLPGVIVALEQGLGKTPLALALMRANHQGALVAVPSAVANTWGEAEAKFFKRQMTNIIAHGSHESRVKALSDSKLPINVVTFEFLRSDTFNRFKIMNRNPQQLLFLDESKVSPP